MQTDKLGQIRDQDRCLLCGQSEDGQVESPQQEASAFPLLLGARCGPLRSKKPGMQGPEAKLGSESQLFALLSTSPLRSLAAASLLTGQEAFAELHLPVLRKAENPVACPLSTYDLRLP